MALRETSQTTDSDLFRQELSNIINLRHPLVQLSQKIDWQSCESCFGGLYASGVGRPGHPKRLIVGLELLKLTCNVSDEEVAPACVSAGSAFIVMSSLMQCMGFFDEFRAIGL